MSAVSKLRGFSNRGFGVRNDELRLDRDTVNSIASMGMDGV